MRTEIGTLARQPIKCTQSPWNRGAENYSDRGTDFSCEAGEMDPHNKMITLSDVTLTLLYALVHSTTTWSKHW